MDNSAKQPKYEFNVPLLLDIIKKSKRQFYKWGIIAFVFGAIVAFSIPRIYKASVMLAPESAQSGLMSSISSLSSIVGLGTNMNPTGDAIYPEIYPDLFSSPEFAVGLFDIQVESLDGSIKTTYYDYKRHYQKSPWWDYPMLLFQRFVKSLKGEDPNAPKGNKVDPFHLSRDQYAVMRSISKDLICSVDKKTSVISLVVTAQDPKIAALMADSATYYLQSFITKYRTQKAVEDYAYLNKLLDAAKADYQQARRDYAAFCDANNDVMLKSVLSKQEEMESNMQLKYNVYSTIVQQVQMANARIQEKTPAFTTLQTATIPIKHSNTSKIVIVSIFMFIAFFIKLCLLVWHNRKKILIVNNTESIEQLGVTDEFE